MASIIDFCTVNPVYSKDLGVTPHFKVPGYRRYAANWSSENWDDSSRNVRWNTARFFLLTQGYVPVYLRMTIAEKKEQDIHP